MPRIGLGTSGLNKTHKDFIVKAVVEGGYRHIDTASEYGNEQMIGDAIEEIEEKGISRNDLYITTKLWMTDHRTPMRSLKKSLERLRISYVDQYLIHWPINQFNNETGKYHRHPVYKVWAGMEECVAKNYAKSIGVSNFNFQSLADLSTHARMSPT
jgi:diketogulonate reductase-like aldo/keto reductase